MKIKEIIYEQIVTEVNKADIIFSHRGKAVVDTNHATSRFLSRLNTELDMTTFFKNMIDRIVALDDKRPVPEEMLVYSKSYNQALIVAYRKDRFDRQDNTKHFYIITYLPPGKKNPKPGTFSVLIEHAECMVSCSSNLLSYLTSIINSRRVKLNEQCDYHPISLVNGLDHKIIISNNKLFDLSLVPVEIE